MDIRNGFRLLAAIFALGFCLVLPFAVHAGEEQANTKKPWQCTLRLLDPDGKPVDGGKVIVYQETKEWMPGTPAWEVFAPVDPSEHVSDKNGRVTIRYSEPPAKALYIEIKAEGYIPLRYAFGEGEWSVDGPDIGEIPREFDVHLSYGVQAGGVVRGSDGKPVEGAVVVVLAKGGLSETTGSPEPLDTFFLVLKTDAAGKWACRVPPPDEELEMPASELSEIQAAEMLQELNGEFDIDDVLVTVTVFHSDHAPKKTRCLPEEFFRLFKPHKELLRAFEKAGFVAGTTFDVVLENGVDLTGRVVDESGKPLEKRALSCSGPRLTWCLAVVTAETGEDGRFVIRHLLEEPSILFASRDGFAPCIRLLEVAADTEPLQLVHEEGPARQADGPRFVGQGGPRRGYPFPLTKDSFSTFLWVCPQDRRRGQLDVELRSGQTVFVHYLGRRIRHRPPRPAAGRARDHAEAARLRHRPRYRRQDESAHQAVLRIAKEGD